MSFFSTMGKRECVKATGCMAAILLLASASALAWQQSTAEAPQVIDVVAKNYEFIPSEIRVRTGARVQLRLRTADRAHGLKLDIYPDGAPRKGDPGLVFAHPQDSAKVSHDQERIIEFVAAKPGTYEFKCSVQCGLLGHGRMKGKLIVED